MSLTPVLAMLAGVLIVGVTLALLRKASLALRRRRVRNAAADAREAIRARGTVPRLQVELDALRRDNAEAPTQVINVGHHLPRHAAPDAPAEDLRRERAEILEELLADIREAEQRAEQAGLVTR